jgi:hydroxymethylbilane synthase
VSKSYLSQKTFRLGSRRSDLALWQTNYVRGLLLEAWPDMPVTVETITTRGDQVLDTPLPLIGGKGLFTAELEAALKSGAIDAAVHSLKDLPTEGPPGLAVGAIPPRAKPVDVLVSREGYTLETLPPGATVGTGSPRRAAQLQSLRPDLEIAGIRGNVPTRIRKAMDPNGPYDAIILAHAGLERLGRMDVISQVLPLEWMLPAAGQGALAVQCRDEATSRERVAPVNHTATSAAVTAERGFLAGLGGGCALPIAAHASVHNGQLALHGRVNSIDGSRKINVQGEGSLEAAWELGRNLAEEALARGAGDLLEGNS